MKNLKVYAAMAMTMMAVAGTAVRKPLRNRKSRMRILRMQPGFCVW